MGAPTGCIAGAADATVVDKVHGKESWDAPAPGATSPRRSVSAPAPGADAPGFSSFWELRRSVVYPEFIFSDSHPVLSESILHSHRESF